MANDYSDLWGEVDIEARADFKSEQKAFFERIRKYRLPSFEEVDGELKVLSTKAQRKAYYQDIARRYTLYFAESKDRNLEFKTK